VAIVAGEWTDRWLGLVSAAFGVAMLLVLRTELSSRPLKAALATAALAPLALTPWIGLADGPFTAYLLAAILAIRRGAVTLGAVLLGLAACVKNEGLVLIVAVAVAMFAARRGRELLRLWPAVVIPLPWLILRAVHGLTTDLVSGDLMARIARNAAGIGALLQHPLGKPLLWIGIALALVLLGRRGIARERFALTAVVLQFGFYVAAYLTSPYDLSWHILYSWDRLVSHLAPVLAFVATSALLEGE
jgi:hypothetical protein